MAWRRLRMLLISWVAVSQAPASCSTSSGDRRLVLPERGLRRAPPGEISLLERGRGHRLVIQQGRDQGAGLRTSPPSGPAVARPVLGRQRDPVPGTGDHVLAGVQYRGDQAVAGYGSSGPVVARSRFLPPAFPRRRRQPPQTATRTRFLRVARRVGYGRVCNIGVKTAIQVPYFGIYVLPGVLAVV
jgi:hypothetical protein